MDCFHQVVLVILTWDLISILAIICLIIYDQTGYHSALVRMSERQSPVIVAARRGLGTI